MESQWPKPWWVFRQTHNDVTTELCELDDTFPGSLDVRENFTLKFFLQHIYCIGILLNPLVRSNKETTREVLSVSRVLCSLCQVFLVRKIKGPDAGQLYAMKVLKKATLKGEGFKKVTLEAYNWVLRSARYLGRLLILFNAACCRQLSLREYIRHVAL